VVKEDQLRNIYVTSGYQQKIKRHNHIAGTLKNTKKRLKLIMNSQKIRMIFRQPLEGL